MLKVIGYIRVSTEEQSKDGISLLVQREKIVAYCKLYDLELVEIIEDGGQSAKSLNRPGIQKVFEMLRRNQVEGVVIAKMDRLSRSVADWNMLIDQFFGDKPGKKLFSVGDSIDTRTAAGRLVLNVLMSVAQWEREAIGERTRDALQGFKKNRLVSKRIKAMYPDGVPEDVAEKFGGKLGGAIPGIWDGREHKRDASLAKAVKAAAIACKQRAREENSHVVEVAMELREQGKPYHVIAEEINQRGLKTRRGCEWSAGTICRVLQAV